MTRDINQEITDTIIQQLETNQAPWQKPWKGGGIDFRLPVNSYTGNHYRGINIVMLWLANENKGFTCHEWGSYKQWQEKKQQVRKGERGTQIVYYDVLERGEGENVQKIPYIKASSVFNKCQLEGFEAANDDTEAPLVERLAQVDQYIKNTQITVEHQNYGGAFYSKRDDKVVVPFPEQFIGTDHQTPTESYYATTLHELTHATGHEKRCNRQFGKRFGDKEYAFEELVAELGSAFLCAGLQITDGPKPNHVSYIGHWLDILKADKRAILTAASEATKSTDFLNALQLKQEAA